MTAYRVVLLDCDICGEVFDPGPDGIRVSFAAVRRLAWQKIRVFGVIEDGWRSWRNIDICPNHNDLTMPQALDEVERFRQGAGLSPEPDDRA